MSRTSLPRLLVLVLVALFAAPIAVATTDGPQESVTGVLETYHVDNFKATHEGDDEGYDLRTSQGVVQLAFPDEGPEDLAGATVTVTGTRVGRTIRMASSRPGASLRIRRPAPAPKTAL